MQVPLVDLRAQYSCIKQEIDAAIQRVLSHTGFILGREVEEFEKAFAFYVDAAAAVGVASGTSAIRLALQALGIGEGDAVITSAHTFIATAEAISQLRAVPVFVDVHPRTYTIDPNRIEELLKRGGYRFRAILPVHIYGQPADMDPIIDLARRHDLRVIEDAAQAHGAEYKQRRCGNIGDLACFSFYPGKNLGAYGDAGIVTGNDRDTLQKVRRLRDHGRVDKYRHEEIGWAERMDALQAAVLGVKLKYLEGWNEARRKHARMVTDLLGGCDVVVPFEAPYARHVYHLYAIQTDRRDKILSYLVGKGIQAGIHYPIPVHRQPAYFLCYSNTKLPITERLADRLLSLPMYPELTEVQISHVAECVRSFFNG